MAEPFSVAVGAIAASSLVTALTLGIARSPQSLVKKSAAPTQFGISTLYRPLNPDVDIVLVHGLETDNKAAWTEITPGGGEYCWPETELPSRLEDQHHIQARITIYNYDSKLRTPEYLTRRTLLHQAGRLIEALAQYREKNNPPPIVFVCHSLGGLLVKNALVSARTSEIKHLNQIYHATGGIVFLGTPHNTSPIGLADSLCNIVAGKKAFNDELTRELRRRSTGLAYTLERFKPLAAHLHICAIMGSSYPSDPDTQKNLSAQSKKPRHSFIKLSRAHAKLSKFSNSNDKDLEKIIHSIGEVCTEVKINPKPKEPLFEHERRTFISSETYSLGLDKVLQDQCAILTYKQVSEQLIELEKRFAKWPNGPPPNDRARINSWTALSPLSLGIHKWMGNWFGETKEDLSASEEYPWPIYVLQGPSGCGKTETALRYVNRNKDKYGSVLWVNATNRKSIELSFRDITRRIISQNPQSSIVDSSILDVLNSEKSLDNKGFYTIVQAVTEWLARPFEKCWLLVLDSLSLRSEYPTPAIWSGHVTQGKSKGPSWRELLNLIPSTANGCGHIIISTSDSDSALDLMAIPFSKCLLAAEQKIDSDMQTHFSTDFYDRIISWWNTAQTWEQNILATTLFLSNKGCPRVPLSLFKADLESSGSSAKLKIPELEQDALYVLPSDGILEKGPNLLSRLCPNAEYNRIATNMAERTWKRLNETMMEIQNQPDLIFSWDLGAQLVRNMSATRLRCDAIFGSSESSILEQGQWARLASVCENHADYTTAAALYQLERTKHEHGTEADLVLLLHCARVYQRDGNVKAAQSTFEDLEKILNSKEIETFHNERIAAYRQFASLRASQNKFEDAVTEMSKVLELEDPFGADASDKQMIESIGELATYLAKKGDRAAASAMFQRMLVSLEETQGMMHPATLGAMEALSAIKLKQGEFQDANRLLSRVHDCQTQRLGHNHPSTVMCESKMAVALDLEGRTREAEDKYKKCLDAAVQSLGLRHPLVFEIRENLFRCLLSQGKRIEASQHLNKLRAETKLFPGLYSNAAVRRINHFQDENGDLDGFGFDPILSTRRTMGVGVGYAESEYDTDNDDSGDDMDGLC